MRQKKIQKGAAKKTQKAKPIRDDDYDITSQSLSEQGDAYEPEDYIETNETNEERRFRLAQKLIEKTKKALNDDPYLVDQDDQTADFFLKQSEAQKRKLKITLINSIKDFHSKNQGAFPEQTLKGHLKPITACAFSPSKDLYTAGKDGAILKYSHQDNFKRSIFSAGYPKDPNGHKGEILCIAISADGKRLLTGGADCMVKLWDCSAAPTFLADFQGHKAAVHMVCFRPQTTECLSASADRTLKVWEYQQKGLIQTLFGHKSEMLDLSVLGQNTAVSVSYDRTPILWHLDKETQAQFAEQPFSLDCVVSVDQQHFITGSEGGELAMWLTSKKKPTCRIPHAHKGGWVSALASLPNSDFFVSGANDGKVVIYRVNGDAFSREIEIPCQGVVNYAALSSDGTMLAFVESCENRLGRWTVQPKAKSQIKLISLLDK